MVPGFERVATNQIFYTNYNMGMFKAQQMTLDVLCQYLGIA